MIEIETVHSGGGGQGFLYNLVVHGTNVYAAGGTYHQPTLLHSSDRGHYRRANTGRFARCDDRSQGNDLAITAPRARPRAAALTALRR